jgi:hypothetical protein
MAQKRYTVEQIIVKLREAEIELAQGAKTPQACRKLGISENTYYRWRKEYGGLEERSTTSTSSRACRHSWNARAASSDRLLGEIYEERPGINSKAISLSLPLR